MLSLQPQPSSGQKSSTPAAAWPATYGVAEWHEAAAPLDRHLRAASVSMIGEGTYASSQNHFGSEESPVASAWIVRPEVGLPW